MKKITMAALVATLLGVAAAMPTVVFAQNNAQKSSKPKATKTSAPRLEACSSYCERKYMGEPRRIAHCHSIGNCDHSR